MGRAVMQVLKLVDALWRGFCAAKAFYKLFTAVLAQFCRKDLEDARLLVYLFFLVQTLLGSDQL